MAFAEKITEFKNGKTVSDGTVALGEIFDDEYDNVYSKINTLHAAVLSSFGTEVRRLFRLEWRRAAADSNRRRGY